LDVDLLFVVVIFLLASKSFIEPFALPTAATLRLGIDLKASPVPTVVGASCFQGFGGVLCLGARVVRQVL
jgi:hypothetical protein